MKRLLVFLSVILVLGIVLWNVLPVSASIKVNPGYLSLSINQNNISSSLTDAGLEYPPETDTLNKKLNTVYSLIEQARLEHNKQGEIARKDPKKYVETGVWNEYSKHFHEKYRWLLYEEGQLKEAIRSATYTDSQWDAITKNPYIYEDACDAMWGVRENLKDEPVPERTNCDSLNLIKAKTIDDIKAVWPVDPTEDFTTYTEVDSGTYLTVTADRVTWTDAVMGNADYVYDDKGAGHFDSDWEHLLQGQTSTFSATGGNFHFYEVSDSIGRYYDIRVAGGNQVGAMYYQSGGGTYRIYTTELDSSTERLGTYQNISTATTYYYKALMDSGVGTFGTFYLYIYTDAARTSLLGTPYITMAEYHTYQYIYPYQAYGASTTQVASGYTEYLDLQEAAPAPEITVSPSSKAFGVLYHGQTYWSYNATLGYSPSWPLDSSQCYAYLENTGTAAGLVTANTTNLTGGITITLADTAPDTTAARMSLFKAGDGSTDNVTIVPGIERTFLPSMASGNVTYFDIKIEWCTGYENDDQQKTGFITFLISAL